MLNQVALAAELLAGHPETGDYSDNHAIAAAQINLENRSVPVDTLSANDLFSATNAIEFSGKSLHRHVLWVSWCGADRDPHDPTNEAFVKWIFGNESQTTGSLIAMRDKPASRAVEQGISNRRVRAEEIKRARI